MSKLAAVLIRSMQGMNQDVRDTLQLLNIHKKHSAIVVENNPQKLGMLKKAEGYITFGEVTEDTIKLIEKQKGKDKVARLHPPRGGFERKGIKKHFNQGGALGKRTNMDELIKRMVK